MSADKSDMSKRVRHPVWIPRSAAMAAMGLAGRTKSLLHELDRKNTRNLADNGQSDRLDSSLDNSCD